MSDTQLEIDSLLEQVRIGAPNAAQEFVKRYGHHIMRVIRHRLHREMRSVYDSQDFMQSVWASFFALPLEDYRFDHPDALVTFLMHLANNKVVEAVRQRLLSQKKAAARELPLTDLPQTMEDQLVAPEPTPAQIAIAREEWQRLLRTQPAHYQRMLIMLSGGQTHEQVAQELGLNEKTIRRVIRRLSSRTEYESR
jgi:RNA polymerase sigma factor (sigma-70 family)